MSFWKSKKRGLSSDLLRRCIYNHCPARERGYWSCCLLMMYQYRMLMCQYITLSEAARAALSSSTASTCSATLQCWAYMKFPSVCCCWRTSPWAASHGCSASRWARRERKQTTTKAKTTKHCVIFTARTEQGRITTINFSPLHSQCVLITLVQPILSQNNLEISSNEHWNLHPLLASHDIYPHRRSGANSMICVSPHFNSS